jgi:hypothetical protein
VFGELNPEAFLRVCDPFDGGHRNREREVADGAYSYNRNLKFKFYRQATNKIVGISDEATAFLDGFF